MLQKTLIDNRCCYFFDNRFFEFMGKKYEIVGSRSTGRGAHDVTHRIKYPDGKYKEVPMIELIKRLTSEKARTAR